MTTPIQLTQVTTQGPQIVAEIATQTGSTDILSVKLSCQQVSGGTISQYSDENGEIRVHTSSSHGLGDGNRVLINDSPAPEANGEWTIHNVDDSSFVLFHSHFEGNISASGATWALQATQLIANATQSSIGNWDATVTTTRPGTYIVIAKLFWKGAPSVIFSAPKNAIIT